MSIPNENSIVKQLHEAGAFIFPCGRFGDAKVPQGSWNPDSENKATRRKAAADKGKSGECTAESLDRWLKKDVPFGMIPGRCGIPLYVVDVDSVIVNGVQKRFGDGSKKQQQAAFAEIKSRIGGPLAACRSGGKSGGWHLFYKLHPQDGGYDPEDEASQGYTKGKFEPPHCGGEVICRNGYVVIWSPKTVLKALKKAENAAETRMAPLFEPVINATNGAESAWMQAAAGRTKQILQNKEDDVSITDDMRRFMLDYVQNDARYKLTGSEYKGPDPRNGNGHDRLKVDAESGSWLLRKAGGKDDEDDKKINRRLPLELGYAPPEDPYHSASEYNLSRIFCEAYGDVCKHDGSDWWTFDETSKRWEEGDSPVKRKVWNVLLAKAPDPGPKTPAMDKDLHKGLKSRHLAVCKSSTCNAVLAIAASFSECRIKPEEIDGKTHLLGLPDGQCWNLETNEIRPAKSEDMLTRSLGASPNTTDYRETELHSVLMDALTPHYGESSASVIEYLLKIMGHYLACDHSQEVFLDFTGPAGGGKSLQSEFWRSAFGGYASSISSAMADARGNPHPEWKLALAKGNRLVIASDVNSGKFDADTITAATSGEVFTARGMREGSRDIRPTAGILICNNDIPKGSGGVFRRIRLVHFRKTVPRDEQDRGLKEKLSTPETMGAWLAAARAFWLEVRKSDRRDAGLPDLMRRDCMRYQENSDTVSAFVAQTLKKTDPAEGEYELADNVYEKYEKHIEECSIPHKLSKPRLMTALDSGPWGFVYNRRLRDGPLRLRALLNCGIMTDFDRDQLEKEEEEAKKPILGQKKCPIDISDDSKKVVHKTLIVKGQKKCPTAEADQSADSAEFDDDDPTAPGIW